MSLKQFLTSHPYLSYNALTLPLSFVALSSTPSLASVSLLLAVLILQTTTTLNRNVYQIIPIILNIAVGSTLANLSASTTALSSPTSSFFMSLARGVFFAIIAMIPLALRYMITRQPVSPWFKITAFPALWAISWGLIADGSPFGRFGSWTPLVGDEGYRWLRPITGLAGVDFVAAGFAEVIASVAGLWLQGSQDEDFEEAHEREALIGHEHNGLDYGTIPQLQASRKPRPNSTLILAGILFILSLPSYYISPLPLPIYSDDTTPLSVACVLPPHRSPDSPKTPFDLYILETRAVAPRAKIVLWPEGAVSFRTSTERKEAVKLLRNTTVGNKVWVGMSFEEPANNGLAGDDKDDGHRAKLVRNGMVLISPNKEEEPIVFEYFKRNLVPIAESYSQVPGHENPPISTISLPAPPGLPKPEKRSYPRPLSLTTSICLDFTQPFPRLPHHPDLILAPARTWHPSVGLAMASLASARAEEIGASVLWCDGGSGAVNGVYGSGRGNRGLLIEEVGNGGRSWVATLGVPYNKGKGEERSRTIYGWAGDSAALFFLCTILALGWGVETTFERLNTSGGWEGRVDHAFGAGLEQVRLTRLIYPIIRLIGYFRSPRERRTVPVGPLFEA